MKKTHVLASLLVLLAIGCNRSRSGNSQPVLRLAMIPSTDPGKIVRESQPVVNYLEKETSSRVELVVPTNYAAVVEAIANDRVDIAYLGGFTFVQASKRAGVQPRSRQRRSLRDWNQGLPVAPSMPQFRTLLPGWRIR